MDASTKMTGFNGHGMGWCRDNPDFRDYTLKLPSVESVLDSKAFKLFRQDLPARIDLRDYFLPVRNQSTLNAASAYAAVALHEYFSARLRNSCSEGSALFVFKMAQKLDRKCENVGVGLRSVLKAIRRFGLPDEEFFPSTADNLSLELPAHLFSFRSNEYSPAYIRLDDSDVDSTKILHRIKQFVAAGFPCVCGFPVPKSMDDSGNISFRSTSDGIRGGQAVVVAGYDDERLPDHSGALLIRSSWGPEWGDGGYGWLPYAFVLDQLAVDFWTLFLSEWLTPQTFALDEV